MTGRVTLAILAAALTVGVTGCGGEENSSSETTAATTAAAGSAQTVSVSETEFALDPDTVTLDSAGTYTFRAVNDGSVDHALEIEGNGVEEETDTIGAGESAEVTVELKEGTYEIYCPIDGHKDQGMVGKVVVGSGGGATTNGETTTTNGETDTDEDSGGYGY